MLCFAELPDEESCSDMSDLESPSVDLEEEEDTVDAKDPKAKPSKKKRKKHDPTKRRKIRLAFVF